MNIRDRKIFYALMTLLGLMGVLTSCHREDPTPTYETDIPISFAPSSDWPELTKATLYESNDDLEDDGIVIWGNLSITDSDIVYPVFDDEDGIGTIATYPDWDYGPAKYWQPGTYTFASVLPASIFNSNLADTDNNIAPSCGKYTASWLENDSFSRLDFNPSFDLSTDQIDLMTAFPDPIAFTEDHLNGKETMGAVQLDFKHTLALLNFSIVNAIGSESTITVNSVELYGNYAAAGYLTPDDGWSYDTDSKTDSETPFYAYTWDKDNPVSKSETETAALIQDLLVFPEAPEEGDEPSKVIIEVYFKETLSSSENTTTRYAQIPMNWVAGQTYTYECRITPSSLVVIQKSDTEWTEINDITHTFN